MSTVPLYSLQAEEALVGSIFVEGELIKECSILPEQLHSGNLRKIYTAMKKLDEKGCRVDIVSLVEQIGVEELRQIGGSGYLVELAGSVPTTANFQFYVNTVKEYDQRRKAIAVANQLIEDAHSGEIGEMGKIIRDGIQQLMTVEDTTTSPDDSGQIRPCLVEVYEDCEKNASELNGIASGFKELDQLTAGFQASDLIIVGARPSVGKTAYALQLALTAAEQDVSVIFSMEMPKKQLLKRAVCTLGGISSTKMRDPKQLFAEGDWQSFTAAMGQVSNRNLHIFDQGGMDIRYIWSKVRKIRRDYPCEKRILVVIDYLQLILGDPKHRNNRVAEIGEISRMLKLMARELNVAVLALSQLSRGVESRQNKRPMLRDLRESGQIEQDADIITFLYRDDYYNDNNNENDGSHQKNILEIIIAKQRNGPIGTVKLQFDKECGRFRN